MLTQSLVPGGAEGGRKEGKGKGLEALWVLNEPLPAGYSELFYLIHTHVYISKACQLLQNSTFQQLWGREDLKGATAHLQGARAQGGLILGEKNLSQQRMQQEGREISKEI